MRVPNELREGIPGGDVFALPDGLRTVGIVEPQDGRLHEDVRGPEAGRMIGIAFDLGGTSHFRANEDAFTVAAMRKSRRVVERFSRG